MAEELNLYTEEEKCPFLIPREYVIIEYKGKPIPPVIVRGRPLPPDSRITFSPLPASVAAAHIHRGSFVRGEGGPLSSLVKYYGNEWTDKGGGSGSR